MASYPLPTPSSPWPTFNSAQWDASVETITFSYANATYLKLSGGTMTGSINGININLSGNLNMGANSFGTIQAGYLTSITAGTAGATKALVTDGSANIGSINRIGSGGNAISLDFTILTNNISLAGANRTVSNTFQYRQLNTTPLTMTNNYTLASSTDPATMVSSFLAQPTIAATNSSVTTTLATTFYIAGAPLAGTNMTITNAYPLYVASGQSYFGGSLSLSGSILSSTQVDYLTSITPGTVSASKALVVDSNKDLSSLRNMSASKININNPGNTSGYLSIGGFGYKCSLSYDSSNYSIIDTNSTGDLSFITTTGSTFNTFMMRPNGDFSLLNVPRSRFDMGTLTSDILLTLQQTSNITGTYGLGVNAATMNYVSAGNVGHKFYYNSTTTPQILGTTLFNIHSSGNAVATAGLHSTGFSSTGLSGAGVHLHYDSVSNSGELFCYTYPSSGFGNLKLNGTSIFCDASTKYVGINTTTPIASLSVALTSPTTLISRSGAFGFLASTGPGTGVNFTNRSFTIYSESGILVNSGEIDVMSDIRVKHDINPIDDELVDSFIQNISVKSFKKNDDVDDKLHYGFIAQDCAKVSPTLVNLTIDDNIEEYVDEFGFTSPKGFKFSISQGYILAILARKIQLLDEKLKELSSS